VVDGCPAGDRFESLHAAGFTWMPGPGSVDLDTSRDELHALATSGLTAVPEATPSQVAVEALILPCRKRLPQRFAGTRGRVNAAPLGCSRFGDARPGRRQIGSGCCPRGWESRGE